MNSLLRSVCRDRKTTKDKPRRQVKKKKKG